MTRKGRWELRKSGLTWRGRWMLLTWLFKPLYFLYLTPGVAKKHEAVLIGPEDIDRRIGLEFVSLRRARGKP